MTRQNFYAMASILLLGVTSLSSVDFSGEDRLMLGQRVESQLVDSIADGHRTLVSFWASYDAQSVMANKALLSSEAVKGDSSLKVVSISLDEYQSIFEETVRRGNFKADLIERQGSDSQAAKDFKVAGNFGSFLIDEDGLLEAINPKFD